MAYEVIDSMSPLFVGQLSGCAAVVVSGSVFAGKVEKEGIVSETEADEPKEVDFYRDTPLRYAGYLNEIGEAFRPVVAGSIVTFSYVLAITYVFADAISKGTASDKLNKALKGCGLAAVIDTLAFQFLASIIFPGFIINRWVTLSGYLTFTKFQIPTLVAEKLAVSSDQVVFQLPFLGDITPYSVGQSIPTALGLILIPLIVAPLDALTETILDTAVRPVLAQTFPECELPFCDTKSESCPI